MLTLREVALVVVGGGVFGVMALAACTTTPVPPPTPPVVAPAPPQQKAEAQPPRPRPAPPEEPLVVTGPDVEPPPEEPPPEQKPERQLGPSETGLASYYADSLAGNKTASGERYRPDLRTCAHRTFPFGTVVSVVATGTGRATTCRVNDRGPFVKDRIIDVSKKCAKELGMLGPGILKVRVRETGPE